MQQRGVRAVQAQPSQAVHGQLCAPGVNLSTVPIDDNTKLALQVAVALLGVVVVSTGARIPPLPLVRGPAWLVSASAAGVAACMEFRAAHTVTVSLNGKCVKVEEVPACLAMWSDLMPVQACGRW